jgi:two-component system phosphate regulon response regulator PhoB
VTREGKPVDLSNTEFKLLSCFVRHPDRALTYLDILQSVWGHSYLKAKSDVSQYVRYLRQKIEIDPARPDYLQSVRGIGYLFASRL